MFDTPRSGLFRGVVVHSDPATGEVIVNLPSALGEHGTIPIDILDSDRYDGLYDVPEPGTQVVVGSETQDLANAFLIQADPGKARKSPNWDGVMVNGIITTPGTQGWAMDGLGNVEFNDGAFRGDVTIGSLPEGVVMEGDLYVSGTTNISGSRISTGKVEAGGFTWDGTSLFSSAGMRIDLDTGDIISPGLRVTPTDASFSGSVILGTAPDQLTITPADGMDLPLGTDGISRVSWFSSGGTEVSFLRSHYDSVQNSSITRLEAKSLGGGLVMSYVGGPTVISSAGNWLEFAAPGDEGAISLVTDYGRILVGNHPASPHLFLLETIGEINVRWGINIETDQFNEGNRRNLLLGRWPNNSSYSGLFDSGGLTGGYMIMSNGTNTYISTSSSTGSVFIRPGANLASGLSLAASGDHTITGSLGISAGLRGIINLDSATLTAGVGKIRANDVRWKDISDTAHRTYYDSSHDGVSHIGWGGVKQFVGANTTYYTYLTSGGNFYLYNGSSWWNLKGHTTSSSKDTKEDIQDLPSKLDVVRRMRPVSFRRRVPERRPVDPGSPAEQGTRIRLAEEAEQPVELGFIAEELALIDPSVIVPAPAEGESIGVSLERMLAVTVKALQELDARVSAMPGGAKT